MLTPEVGIREFVGNRAEVSHHQASWLMSGRVWHEACGRAQVMLALPPPSVTVITDVACDMDTLPRLRDLCFLVTSEHETVRGSDAVVLYLPPPSRDLSFTRPFEAPTRTHVCLPGLGAHVTGDVSC